MFDCLPDEVLADKILLRLPIKSILQCRCVCKLWRSLITSPNFISTHLRHHSDSEDPQKIFVTQINYVTSRKMFLFNNLAEGHFGPPMSLHLPPPDFQNVTTSRLRILGSVNGLICICLYDVCQRSVYHILMFNPSIGRFLSIPPPPSKPSWSVQAFGFDETTQDYKILLIRGADGASFVYSLNSNSWRRLPIFPLRHFNSGLAVFVNGSIHWIDYTLPLVKRCITVFDVKVETFHEIPFPECLETRYSLTLMEFGASLALSIPTSEGVTHIWVMKEYGLLESWIKLATLDSSPVLLGFRNNDQVLIRLWERYRVGKSGCIASQSIHNNSEVQSLIDLGKDRGSSFGFVYKYLPSLVLLDKQNNVDATFVHATPFPENGQNQGEQQLELRQSKRLRKTPA